MKRHNTTSMKTALVVLILFAMLLMVGCGEKSSHPEELIGTWKVSDAENQLLVFLPDGTLQVITEDIAVDTDADPVDSEIPTMLDSEDSVIEPIPGTWVVTGTSLILNIGEGESSESIGYKYEIDGEKLNLYNREGEAVGTLIRI